jgi:hypothetical protein
MFIAALATLARASDASPTPRKQMTLDSFAESTIAVIREVGIAEYLPTIVLPATQEFRVVEGIPADVDHRAAIQNVIRRSGYTQGEFYFGVRSAPDQIILGHYTPQRATEFMQIVKTSDGYSKKPLLACDWWHIP